MHAGPPSSSPELRLHSRPSLNCRLFCFLRFPFVDVLPFSYISLFTFNLRLHLNTPTSPQPHALIFPHPVLRTCLLPSPQHLSPPPTHRVLISFFMSSSITPLVPSLTLSYTRLVISFYLHPSYHFSSFPLFLFSPFPSSPLHLPFPPPLLSFPLPFPYMSSQLHIAHRLLLSNYSITHS